MTTSLLVMMAITFLGLYIIYSVLYLRENHMAHLDLLKRGVNSLIKAHSCLESLVPVSALFCTKISSCLVSHLLTLLSALFTASLPFRVLASNANYNHTCNC